MIDRSPDLHPPIRPAVEPSFLGGLRSEGGHKAPGGVICACQANVSQQSEILGADEDLFEIPEERVEEDIEELRVAPSPTLPTESEVAEHRITHYPYRSWCKYCVMCKALGEKRQGGNNDKRIPVVSMDYFFMTSGDLVARAELSMSDEELLQQRRTYCQVPFDPMRRNEVSLCPCSAVQRCG